MASFLDYADTVLKMMMIYIQNGLDWSDSMTEMTRVSATA